MMLCTLCGYLWRWIGSIPKDPPPCPKCKGPSEGLETGDHVRYESDYNRFHVERPK